MDAFGTARKLAGIGVAESRAMVDIARTGVLRPSGALHGVAMLRALDAYGPDRGALTFTELDRRSNALANSLRERGLDSGDVIGVLCRNHRGLLDALFGTGKLGAKTLLLNTDFSAPQLRGVCEREGAKLIIYDDEFTDIVATLDPTCGRLLGWRDDSPETTLDELIESASEATPYKPEVKPKLVLLTSGTTGPPKGADREFGLRLAVPGGFLNKIPYRSRRPVLIACPMFHAWGLASTMASIALGNTVVAARTFDPLAVLDSLATFEIDALVTVPILLARLLATGADEIAKRDLSKLRIIALSGSAVSAELATRAMDTFGDVVYNLYGSTEVAYASIATPADMRAAPGSVGRPPYGTTLRLYDEHDHEVGRGETGRIFVSNGAEFEGYTGGGSKDVVDGLMSTGDVGHFDEDGYLFIDGRDDDMIISGGENVFPKEIEELLGEHGAVEEAVLIGVPDEEFGHRLRAYVVRAGDIDEDGIKAYVKQNLARYKVPREVIFLDELPRNPAGKIVKRDLPDYPA
jgi:fatty-acyl-CoA synthase